MRTLVLFAFMLFSINMLFAQKPPTFIEIDTATYRAYLNSDWDRIIKLGDRAIENNIDYYYLRLRIAYSWFKKKRYGQAIPHYKKALEFSSHDPIALEYLYNCYLYTGRINDAEKLVKEFPDALKDYFHKPDSKKISGIEFYSTLSSGGDSELKDEITQTAPLNIEGSQILQNSSVNFNLNLHHKAGYSVIVHHTANLLYKDEYAFAVVKTLPYLSESQEIRQINYQLRIDITPTEGFTITPLLSYINYRVPVFYSYGLGSNKNRDIYAYDKHQEMAFGIKSIKHFKYFDFLLSYTHSNFNLSIQNTAALGLTIYPLNNLNLYVTADAYFHYQSQNENTDQQYIQNYKMGFKVFSNLWLEGFFMNGGFTNFYDPFSSFTYNSLEQYEAIYGMNLILPVYKHNISVFAGYRYYQSNSMFVPVTNVFDTYNSKPFNYQTITGGISWKL